MSLSELEKYVDDVILFVEYASDRSEWGYKMDIAKSMGPMIAFDVTSTRDDQSENFQMFPDVSPRDVNNQYDVSLIRRVSDDAYLCAQRMRSIPLKSVRGRGKIRSPFFVEYSMCLIQEDGTSFPLVKTFNKFGQSNRWENFYNNSHDTQQSQVWKSRLANGPGPGYGNTFSHGEADDQINAAISVAFSMRYWWMVEVGMPGGGPRVRFITDHTGAMAAFKNRSASPGRDRRDALRQWIAGHWRSFGRDRKEETLVRQHLRGATRFSWSGYDCTVIPSQFDSELLEKLRAEREAVGPVRRPRLAKA